MHRNLKCGNSRTSWVNIPQLASGSDDGAVKIWDLGSFLDEFGDGSATSEEQKEIIRSVPTSQCRYSSVVIFPNMVFRADASV